MALVQISIKVEASVREQIKHLINHGKYQDVADFTAKAIYEKLEREGVDVHEPLKKQIIDLIRYDSDIRSTLEAVVLSTNIKFEK
jgi:Arc/MetJ-type ribon-helix-helix transcriptional regulator